MNRIAALPQGAFHPFSPGSTMSIAVSAVIHPSPTLRAAHAALCVAVLACGAWCGASLAGALLVAAGVAGAVRQRGLVKLARIDISAVGQVRLAVYHQKDARHAGLGQSVRLLPGSTLWPGLLLLRLRLDAAETVPEDAAEPAAEDTAGSIADGTGEDSGARRGGREAGRVHWLAVLPDSAAPDVRRRLALAARAIAARGTGGAKKNPQNP
ncbi:hypothetical protein [Pseudoduganella albidiflava]|uniref:DUF58 domain-containing protein n=1 Tax=Pseudoduganella albidiflava TaxID=321983 RepID=A0A411WW76_9BURK|nr:hypothetical protein [Pseudoduganella albidiflava]QBI00747.1 hypothetical protein EYF70_07685 [Pseudoduganella albidiflava]GGY30991.1 hypothetical protein GCM10007387_11100 [Pseudoduganella albidiflava]